MISFQCQFCSSPLPIVELGSQESFQITALMFYWRMISYSIMEQKSYWRKNSLMSNLWYRFLTLISKSSQLSNHPNDFGLNLPSTVTFSANFAENESVLEIHWLINQVQNESYLAFRDLTRLRHDAASLLNQNDTHLQNQSRDKRVAPLSLAALASVGLCGSWFLLGSSGGCGLRKVFESYQDRRNENAENIFPRQLRWE